MIVYMIVWFILALSVFILLLKCQNWIDRIIVWDFFSVLLVVLFLLMAVYWNEPFWVDVSVVLSGVAFISTTLWARYALLMSDGSDY